MFIASSECGLQALVTTLKEGYENNGLSLNTSKTKVLVFERNEEKTKCKISVKGKILEQVNEVVYLVSIFSRDEKYEIDAKRHIAACNRAYDAFAALMRRRKHSIKNTQGIYEEVDDSGRGERRIQRERELSLSLASDKARS